MSKHMYRDYIVIDGSDFDELRINWPYNQNRISKHLLGTDEYAKGITFNLPNVRYQVKYTPNGSSETAYSPEYVYDDKLPVIPTNQMENITIKAWIDGNMEEAFEHTIHFIDLGMPPIRLNNVINNNGNYPQGTKAWIQNEHSDKGNVLVFFTTDGSDPTSATSSRSYFGQAVESNEIILQNTTTIKSVYFSACNHSNCSACKEGAPQNCTQGVYGKVYEGVYPIVQTPIYGGGGGGDGGVTTIDNTRKYTKDIFGNEHPTHIGYINGYPDGSVNPEGDITREEIAVILYRIANHAYEKPFVATGAVFPDVDSSRWSVHNVEYMADSNVIEGYPDGEFKPEKSLTRAEFVTLIYRFANVEETDIKNPFYDLAENHWAYHEILSLAQAGLIQGYEDSSFLPENNITRAEVMTVINKLLGRKPLESYINSLDFTPYNDLLKEKWYYVNVLEATITHNYWLNQEGYEYMWEGWK